MTAGLSVCDGRAVDLCISAALHGAQSGCLAGAEMRGGGLPFSANARADVCISALRRLRSLEFAEILAIFAEIQIGSLHAETPIVSSFCRDAEISEIFPNVLRTPVFCPMGKGAGIYLCYLCISANMADCGEGWEPVLPPHGGVICPYGRGRG